jgi:hypothetical protein
MNAKGLVGRMLTQDVFHVTHHVRVRKISIETKNVLLIKFKQMGNAACFVSYCSQNTSKMEQQLEIIKMEDVYIKTRLRESYYIRLLEEKTKVYRQNVYFSQYDNQEFGTRQCMTIFVL